MESVNAKDRHGHTPLISASKEGLKDFVLDLLHRGADITASSDKGKTASSLCGCQRAYRNCQDAD